jgi:hypothetical protein
MIKLAEMRRKDKTVEVSQLTLPHYTIQAKVLQVPATEWR